jgi:hypothetical protein
MPVERGGHPGVGFQKSGFVGFPPAAPRGVRRHGPHSVVGGRYARPMPEHYNSSPHLYKMMSGASGSGVFASVASWLP